MPTVPIAFSLCLYVDMYVYTHTYIYIYILHIFIYILYIYILKRHYKEIEKSIFQKRMMVKNIYFYENLKSPYISLKNNCHFVLS